MEVSHICGGGWAHCLHCMSVCLCRIVYIHICMYCIGLYTKCRALAVHCHIQFCCSNQFVPFASSPSLPCTAPAPHPPPVMTEPHPMAKQRPTGSPHNERKCLLSILPHVNSCEFEFGGYGSQVVMSQYYILYITPSRGRANTVGVS